MPQYPAVIELSALSGADGFRLSGENLYDRAGTSVASAGDVNGDGFDDLIISAPPASPTDRNDGATYVVFGRAGGFGANLNLSALDGVNGFQISGIAAYDNSGAQVSSAGDVNGDGFDDLLIGAPGVDQNGANAGAAYVLYGRASGFAAEFELAFVDGINGVVLLGESSGDGAGRAVASAGA
jgi:hypothetical protein